MSHSMRDSSPPGQSQTCMICTNPYNTGDASEAAEALVCGHVYGENCLQQWFAESFTCPSCRRNPATGEEVVEVSDDEESSTDDEEEMPAIDYIPNSAFRTVHSSVCRFEYADLEGQSPVYEIYCCPNRWRTQSADETLRVLAQEQIMSTPLSEAADTVERYGGLGITYRFGKIEDAIENGLARQQDSSSTQSPACIELRHRLSLLRQEIVTKCIEQPTAWKLRSAIEVALLYARRLTARGEARRAVIRAMQMGTAYELPADSAATPEQLSEAREIIRPLREKLDRVETLIDYGVPGNDIPDVPVKRDILAACGSESVHPETVQNSTSCNDQNMVDEHAESDFGTQPQRPVAEEQSANTNDELKEFGIFNIPDESFKWISLTFCDIGCAYVRGQGSVYDIRDWRRTKSPSTALSVLSGLCMSKASPRECAKSIERHGGWFMMQIYDAIESDFREKGAQQPDISKAQCLPIRDLLEEMAQARKRVTEFCLHAPSKCKLVTAISAALLQTRKTEVSVGLREALLDSVLYDGRVHQNEDAEQVTPTILEHAKAVVRPLSEKLEDVERRVEEGANVRDIPDVSITDAYLEVCGVKDNHSTGHASEDTTTEAANDAPISDSEQISGQNINESSIDHDRPATKDGQQGSRDNVVETEPDDRREQAERIQIGNDGEDQIRAAVTFPAGLLTIGQKRKLSWSVQFGMRDVEDAKRTRGNEE